MPRTSRQIFNRRKSASHAAAPSAIGGLLTLFLAIVVGTTISQAQTDNTDRQRLIGEPAQVKYLDPNDQTVAFGGSVVPFREATLAAQMPGRIEHLAGEEGDAFEDGDLLVRLDDDELIAQQNQANAELANATASLRNAGVQYNRELYSPYSLNRSPGGMGLPTLMDQMFTRPFSNVIGTTNPDVERHASLFQQGTQIETARNAILAAQSKLQQIDAKLRDTRTYAPFDGVIISKFVELGDSVQPGAPLYKFADLRYLQIKVDVPERFAVNLRKGQILKARIDVLNADADVRVAQIFPVADELRHTVTVKFDLKTTSNARSGMYAKVLLPDPGSKARPELVIPTSAIVRSGSLPRVYVVEGDKYRLRLIRVGEALANGMSTVLSGLSVDEYVLDKPRPESSGPPRGSYDAWGRRQSQSEYTFEPG